MYFCQSVDVKVPVLDVFMAVILCMTVLYRQRFIHFDKYTYRCISAGCKNAMYPDGHQDTLQFENPNTEIFVTYLIIRLP